MAAPTSYTEATLQAYLFDVLGESELAAALGWPLGSPAYKQAVDEALLTYGVDDIATVTGRDSIRKLRAIARLELWRSVMQRTAGDYAFRTEAGATFNREQAHAQAVLMFRTAESEVIAFGFILPANYAVGMTHVTYPDDPYDSDLDTDNEWSRVQ